MDFQKLTRKAQDVYTKRGGADAAKGDASEVEEILKGGGTFAEKAKRAAKALKEPGAASERNNATTPASPAPTEPTTGLPEPPSGSR